MFIQLVTSIILFTPPAVTTEPIELLPGIYVSQGMVEFEGKVSIDCHHPDSPDVYLEMFVTAPDSREHEALFVADIQPSSLHGALLAAGFNSGEPISWGTQSNNHTTTNATGDQLQVLYSLVVDKDAEPEFLPIESLVIDLHTRDSLLEDDHRPSLVFAGSSFNNTGYAADQSGALISLTPFGDEVISPTWSLSPQADIDEPVWIADNELLPEIHTPVRIRIVKTRVEAEQDSVDSVDTQEKLQ